MKPSRRPKPPRFLLTILAAVSAAVGCERSAETPGASPPEQAIRLRDASGSEVVLPSAAQRVVSLVPSATETLRALGAGGTVVGRTDFDTQPWIRDVPTVGGGIGPNLEAIAALEPDLVVRFAGEQDPRTPGRLDALGIPHVAVRPDRIEDIYRTARLLGLATGRAPAADSLVAGIREGLLRAARRAEGLPRLSVAYVLGGSPPWVAGPGTFIDEVVTLVGGDNVFADLDALYASVSPEELLARDIDVVLVPERAEFDRSLARGARIEVVGPGLEIPGPDVVEAAFRVAEILHGSIQR